MFVLLKRIRQNVLPLNNYPRYKDFDCSTYSKSDFLEIIIPFKCSETYYLIIQQLFSFYIIHANRTKYHLTTWKIHSPPGCPRAPVLGEQKKNPKQWDRPRRLHKGRKS